MYNKNNFAVHKAASKSSIRPEMQCVAFYGDRTIAIDSFQMVEISADGEAHEPILHYAPYVGAVKMPKGVLKMDRKELKLEPVTEKYPDVDAVFKRKFKPVSRIVVNASYLINLSKILGDLNKWKKVTLEVNEEGTMLRITSEDDNAKQKGRALIMGMR